MATSAPLYDPDSSVDLLTFDEGNTSEHFTLKDGHAYYVSRCSITREWKSETERGPAQHPYAYALCKVKPGERSEWQTVYLSLRVMNHLLRKRMGIAGEAIEPMDTTNREDWTP